MAAKKTTGTGKGRETGKGKPTTNVEEVTEPKLVKKTLTQEDIDLMAPGHSYKVGDVVEVEDENAGDELVEEAENTNKIKAPKKGAVSVDVIKDGVEYVRTYSEEVHGEDFMTLAETFVEGKKGYELVDSDAIEIVLVNYRLLDKKTGISTETVKAFSHVNGEDFKDQALALRNDQSGVVLIK